MLLIMVAMLAAHHILLFSGVFLQILSAVLGIIQVSLGAEFTPERDGLVVKTAGVKTFSV